MPRSDSAIPALVLILILASPAGGSEPVFELESWEVRLNQRQPPVRIMDAIGVGPGMTIGEIGAGRGRMTIWLADRVGTEGKVWANDIDEGALGKLRERCEKEGLINIETIVGEVADPKLPAGKLDMAFMINVYHHADDPVALVRNAIPALKPGGVLVIVECCPEKTEWGEEHNCTGRDDMIEQAGRAGYELVRVETFLDEDNIFIFKPQVGGGADEPAGPPAGA
jgi:SAM-dependent methyltransferase